MFVGCVGVMGCIRNEVLPGRSPNEVEVQAMPKRGWSHQKGSMLEEGRVMMLTWRTSKEAPKPIQHWLCQDLDHP